MDNRVGVLNDKKEKVKIIASEKLAKNLIKAGIVMILLFVILGASLIVVPNKQMSISAILSLVLFLIVLLSFGIFTIYYGGKISSDIKHFRRYVSYLQKDETGSIRRLCIEMKESYFDTLENLKKFADKGYFSNIVIDEKLECVKFPDRIRKYSDVGYETITCPGCSVTKLLPKSSSQRCEYCGKLLISSKDVELQKKAQ